MNKIDDRMGWRQATVTLYVKLPNEISPKAVTLTIGEELAACMNPLPRNREIPWEWRDMKEAQEMVEARHRAAKQVAEHITRALLNEFQARDTINGYSPEEWAAMHP